MTQIDEQAEFIHALDTVATSATQSCIRRLHATIAKQITPVIGWLNDVDAKLLEHLQPVRIVLKTYTILQAVKQRELAVLLCPANVIGSLHAGKYRRVQVNQLVPASD